MVTGSSSPGGAIAACPKAYGVALTRGRFSTAGTRVGGGGGGVGGGGTPACVGRSVSTLRRGGGNGGVAPGAAPHDAVRFGNAAASAASGTDDARGMRSGAVFIPGGGGRLEVRPSKNGSSSAMEPSARAGPIPRVSTSPRATCFARMARCSSRSDRNVSRCPLVVWTAHLSPPPSRASGPRTLNWWPQLVQRTVVPRPLTSASSNSYSVLQRSHWTSITHPRLTGSPRPWAVVDARRRRPWKWRPS